jgi:PAS domain S-box-containing protein
MQTMSESSNKSEAEKQIESLRTELGELRAVEMMHRQTQEGLDTIERQLAGIIHSAMDAIITINDEQKIILFNAAAETMFGCSAKSAIGQPIDKFIPQRFHDAHRKHIGEFRDREMTNRRMGALGAIWGLRSNGEEFPIEASISKVHRGEKILFTVILRDISDRKQAEKRIARFANVFEESINEIYFFDADTLKFVQVNRGARENLGYSTEELLQMTPTDIKPEFTRESFVDLLKPLKTGGRQKVEFSTVHQRKDGSTYPVEVHVQLSKIEDSSFFVAIILDVTEKKHLESQLRRTERLAEMGTLAAGMAHEIGTPMNVILGRAEFLMRKTPDDSMKKGLGTIVSQVERITKIMNQLLSFARRRPIERKPLELGKVIHDMLDVVRERLNTRNVVLETFLDPVTPMVFADKDQMGQVVLNLILNAVQAMPEGGTLRVELRGAGSQVKLDITDTGCGIHPDNIPKLFTPFFTTKEVGEGTGLGLTVVHGIVQEHEGNIDVKSDVGKGSTFCLTLPTYDPAIHGK